MTAQAPPEAPFAHQPAGAAAANDDLAPLTSLTQRADDSATASDEPAEETAPPKPTRRAARNSRTRKSDVVAEEASLPDGDGDKPGGREPSGPDDGSLAAND